MRKLVLLAVIMLSMITITSCTTQEIYNETNPFIKVYTVRSNEWTFVRDNDFGAYFYHKEKLPELTADVFEHGIFNGYLYFLRKGQETIAPLPFDDFFNETTGQWTEQVTCEFSPGYVTFILKYDDQTSSPPTYDYDFMVKMLW